MGCYFLQSGRYWRIHVDEVPGGDEELGMWNMGNEVRIIVSFRRVAVSACVDLHDQAGLLAGMGSCLRSRDRHGNKES